MLTVAFPWIFGAAVAASCGITLLHFLSVRTPPVLALPTARFVTTGNARAVARQPRLNDVLLLLLRVLALLCAGAAMSGVRWQRPSASLLRLVVADDAQWGNRPWRDSVARALARADAVVEVHGARGVADDPGAALVAATQHAARAAARHPSLTAVELTLLLPSTAATTQGYAAWRAYWPGAVRVLLTTAPPRVARDSASGVSAVGRGAVRVQGGARDDAVAAAVGPWSLAGALQEVVIERAPAADRTAGADNAAAPAGPFVHWPADGMPQGWIPRAPTDSVGALAAAGGVLVGPFVRVAAPGPHLAARIDSGGRAALPVQVVAWWSDGQPAAVEERGAAGQRAACHRTVAVAVPRGSDLLLSPGARELMNALIAPCGGVRVSSAPAIAQDLVRPVAAPSGSAGSAVSAVAAVSAGDNRRLAPAAAFRDPQLPWQRGSDPWWLAPALLALALLALAAEWLLRDREAVS
ncbi:hypothetical protein [Gemmatimonas sp.]|uniref:hypothetical protein n=1 Tax=Gemmatimonas sp. TaxID=1962908 RepID=UPI00391F395A